MSQLPKTNSRSKVIVIVGPTASGKTDLARRLALKYNGELISADSRQVYRGLNIGTGKEGELKANTLALTEAYTKLRFLEGDIPQWLIDIADPQETYTVADFQKDCLKLVDNIASRGKLPIIVGGTGLYVSAVLDGYDFSEQRERSQDNPRHATQQEYRKTPPDWDILTLGIELPREELYHRIDTRVDRRIEEGMIQEAEELLASGIGADRLRQFGLEYRFLVDYIEKKLSFDEFRTKLKYAIHAFARRQLTWWRHHGPVGFCNDYNTIIDRVSKFLKN